MRKLLIVLLCISSVSYSQTDLTPENVYKYCVEIGIKFPEIVTAQSVEETGWYKCKSCSLDKNNIFGFRYKGSYLKFDTWKKACDYYKKWQLKWYKSNKDYYSFLSCLYVNSNGDCVKYAQSQTYLKKVKTIVNNHQGKWDLTKLN